MIVSGFVVADASPIHRFGGSGRFGETLNDLLVDARRVVPPLLHKLEARFTGQQPGEELVARQISLNAITFWAIRIEKDNTGCPQGVELVEDWSFLLDVEGKRDEGLVNVIRYFRVAVGFGFQPNAASSRGSGGEIEQHGLAGLFGFGESGVQVVFPMD